MGALTRLLNGRSLRGSDSGGRRAFFIAAFVSAFGFGCRKVEIVQPSTGGGPDIAIENVWSLPTFGTVAAAQGRAGGVSSSDAARASSTNQVNGVVYCTIKNRGDSTERLLEASTSVALAVEFHETTIEQSIARMRLIGTIDIPARGQIEFKPAKLHMMLVDLRRELQAGERIPLKLRFEHSGTREVGSEVRA